CAPEPRRDDVPPARGRRAEGRDPGGAERVRVPVLALSRGRLRAGSRLGPALASDPPRARERPPRVPEHRLGPLGRRRLRRPPGPRDHLAAGGDRGSDRAAEEVTGGVRPRPSKPARPAYASTFERGVYASTTYPPLFASFFIDRSPWRSASSSSSENDL